MGYRPSAIGRSLATKETKTFGVVVTTIADPFIADIVSGIEVTANDHGYSVLNHANFANPNTVHGSGPFGSISSVALGSTGRLIQLSLRLEF